MAQVMYPPQAGNMMGGGSGGGMQNFLPQQQGKEMGDQNMQQLQQYSNAQQTLQSIQQQRQQDAYYSQLQNQNQPTYMMNQQDYMAQNYQNGGQQFSQQQSPQGAAGVHYPGDERYDTHRQNLLPQGLSENSKQLPTMNSRQAWENQGELSGGSYSMQGFEIPKTQDKIDMTQVDSKEFKKFVVYYSPSCKFCSNFLSVSATHTDLDDTILKINVDNYEVSGLKGVPTVVDQGIQFLGNQALLWLKQKGVTELKGMDIEDSDESGYCIIDDNALGAGEAGGYCLFEQSTNKTVDFQNLESLDGTGRGMGTSALESQLSALQSSRKNVQVPRQASHTFYQ